MNANYLDFSSSKCTTTLQVEEQHSLSLGSVIPGDSSNKIVSGVKDAADQVSLGNAGLRYSSGFEFSLEYAAEVASKVIIEEEAE